MKTEWKKSLDIVPYLEALKFMETRVDNIINKAQSSLIWFLEHNEVYTAGTSAHEGDLLSNQFPIYNVGRGGKYTYHGPGQRIIYFILDLKQLFEEPDLRKYIYLLEQIIIESLAVFNIFAFRKENKIGIWVNNNQQDYKIASIGIRVKKWTSYHGVAINVDPNLFNFQGIIPCGLKGYGVTSCKALGYDISLDELDEVLKEKISKILKIS